MFPNDAGGASFAKAAITGPCTGFQFQSIINLSTGGVSNHIMLCCMPAKLGSEPLIPASGVSGLGPGCVFTDVKRGELK